MVSSFPAIPHGPLYYRQVENDKIKALKLSCGNFDSCMNLSQTSMNDLLWWIAHVESAETRLIRSDPEFELYTDSSGQAWGAHRKDTDIKAGGPWTASESSQHINVLEIKACLFGLQALCNECRDIHIRLLVDNTTAVTYVKNMGGSHSLQCNEVARDIWQWAINRNIWLTVAHVPGVANVIADRESRKKYQSETEWMLNPIVFRKLASEFTFTADIDLFASRLNKQIDKFVSWNPEPECVGVDAFTMNWRHLNGYIFCPFSVIPRVLQQMSSQQAEALVILPNWPTQPWFPTAMRMLVDKPRLINKHRCLLTLPTQPNKVHPLWDRLELMACHLSGITTKQKAFRKTLLQSYVNHGQMAQSSNTEHISTGGSSFAMNGILIPTIRIFQKF
ncbi:uncharacterized protein LOC106161058 [Lingula anatina]|uniref:Uncharacterized protein LOC106161058 n=1 Tax=Lingula anatina TaxID=7574 RepID=A0A1S3I519_LINAN|nr:uncharacterized protein LOC106161058 [Lingula anatina]|eukprot:XP_013393362.1 uncharacterized protein LOC106161058 [Lingula anatina]